MNGITNQIRVGEDVPLEPGQTSNVFVNTVYLSRKIIDRTPGKNSAMDVEINTKGPVDLHSRKLKCGFIVVIAVSTVSAILSISLAYYQFVNISLLQKQVDFLVMKMENISSQQHSDAPSLASSSAEARMAGPHSVYRDMSTSINQDAVPPIARPIEPLYDHTVSPNGLFVVHFNGAYKNSVNLGRDTSIGPWTRDYVVSTPNSHDKIEMEKNDIIIKESGLYMFYVQIMYETREPSCYTVFATQPGSKPRQLASCATGNDSSPRPAARVRMSCAAHTVARLHTGDVLNISQLERNRTLRLQEGYSFFGLVKLAS